MTLQSKLARLMPIAALAALAACGAEPDESSGMQLDADGPPAAFGSCKACHALEPGHHAIGPSLAGVYGASVAHVGDYAYSPALRSAREAGEVWDAATLDAYLANPQAAMPGTKMSYAGLRDENARAELIAWLERDAKVGEPSEL